MALDLILVTIALLALLIGSLTDMKTREVPDTISYGLIILGVIIQLVIAITTNEWTQLGKNSLWTLLFVGVAFAMFYTGQWGGADSKLLMGLGIVFASYPQTLLNYFNPNLNVPFALSLLVNIFFFGALYGIVISFFQAVTNWNKFSNEWKKQKKLNTKLTKYLTPAFWVLTLLGILFIWIEILISLLFFTFAISILVLLYLMLFAKAVEQSCMIKEMKTEDLTEGEWIVKEYRAKGKYICGPKDLGIENKQIDLLKKHKIKSVIIKQGVPFVPSFLIATLITLIMGNIVLIF
jgi:Flp pilus assembly protein protease CpaA